jgi:C-terminal processing protease CtpA/Prc
VEKEVSLESGFWRQLFPDLSATLLLYWPLAMPPVLLGALWLGVPWLYACWLVCGLGVALCVFAARRRPNGLALYSLLAAGYAASAWLALGLMLDQEPGAQAMAPSQAHLATFLAGAGVLLFVVSAVGLAGAAWRALHANLPLELRPRQLLGGIAAVGICGALMAGLLLSAAVMARHRSNLHLVTALGESGLQVFTPVRYARELLAHHYYWRDDPATPKLASWLGIPTSGLIGDTDAAHRYITAHANPADTWSGASSYDATVSKEMRDAQGSGAGLRLEYEKTKGSAPAKTKPDSQQPLPTGLIASVDTGSAAALAGVQRGDALVSIDGEPLRAMLERLDQEEKSSANSKNQVVPQSAPLIKKPPPVLLIRTISKKLITITTRNTYPTTGVQAVAWFTKDGTPTPPGLRSETLYVRLNKFTPHLGVYAEAAIRKSAQAAVFSPNSRWPDQKQWPGVLLSQVVSTLVLDLRSNPGGDVHAVGDVARRLLGKYLQPGLGLPRISFKDDRSASKLPTVWLEKSSDAPSKASASAQAAPAYQTGMLRALKDIVVLTSPQTCSAAELLTYGLQQHLPDTVRLVIVGEATCGKPYGFEMHEYFGTSIQVADTAWLNAASQPAYPKGIEPTCRSEDQLLGPETTDKDLLFQTAMNYIYNGKCNK